MLFKIISTQVAQQAIFFQGKTVILTFLSDLLKDTLLRIEEEKSPAFGGNQNHNLSATRCVLYRCATTAAPLNHMFLSLTGLKINFQLEKN